jgi:hypothetical protein
MKDWTAKWSGRTVRFYEGPSDGLWEFPEHYFPWICDTDEGLDFISTDWRIKENGDWQAVQAGVSLDDLTDGFLATIDDSHGPEEKQEARARLTAAISALTRALERLRSHSLLTS